MQRESSLQSHDSTHPLSPLLTLTTLSLPCLSGNGLGNGREGGLSAVREAGRRGWGKDTIRKAAAQFHQVKSPLLFFACTWTKEAVCEQ